MKQQEPSPTETSQPTAAERAPHPPRPGGQPAGNVEAEREELFDWAFLARYVGFVLHAVRRHLRLFFFVWGGVVATAAIALLVLPKTYHVETTLQAQRNEVISTLSNPNRSMPLDADAPTRQAAETVLRNDNLVALIHQTDFLKKFKQNRAPLLRVKDLIWPVLFRKPTEEELIESFVYYLGNRLQVQTGDGTVTIAVELPDPKLAYQMTETALQNFLESRHAADVSVIAEAITLLEERAAQSYQNVTTSLERLEALRDERRGRFGRARRAVAVPAEPLAQGAAELLVQVESKKRAIADLEEFRRRRVIEMQTRLQEQRAMYAEGHPAVIDTQASIEALQRESPQVATLRRELEQLLEEAKARKIATNTPAGGNRHSVLVSESRLAPEDPGESEDQQIEYSKEQVRRDLAKYTGFLDRIESARLELDTARLAFKFRYSVIHPARMPRGPIKPKAPLILGGSFMAGLLLAAIAAALRDLQSRTLLESWQVEHELKVPLLSEVTRK